MKSFISLALFLALASTSFAYDKGKKDLDKAFNTPNTKSVPAVVIPGPESRKKASSVETSNSAAIDKEKAQAIINEQIAQLRKDWKAASEKEWSSCLDVDFINEKKKQGYKLRLVEDKTKLKWFILGKKGRKTYADNEPPYIYYCINDKWFPSKVDTVPFHLHEDKKDASFKFHGRVYLFRFSDILNSKQLSLARGMAWAFSGRDAGMTIMPREDSYTAGHWILGLFESHPSLKYAQDADIFDPRVKVAMARLANHTVKTAELSLGKEIPLTDVKIVIYDNYRYRHAVPPSMRRDLTPDRTAMEIYIKNDEGIINKMIFSASHSELTEAAGLR